MVAELAGEVGVRLEAAAAGKAAAAHPVELPAAIDTVRCYASCFAPP